MEFFGFSPLPPVGGEGDKAYDATPHPSPLPSQGRGSFLLLAFLPAPAPAKLLRLCFLNSKTLIAFVPKISYNLLK